MASAGSANVFVTDAVCTTGVVVVTMVSTGIVEQVETTEAVGTQ